MLSSSPEMRRFVAAILVLLVAVVSSPAQQAAPPSDAAPESVTSAPGAEVTYEQLLKDPDNADLNYRYATAQAKKGNLRGALAALERLLIIQPDNYKARLAYAVVLMRLDTFKEAEGILDSLRGSEVPESLRLAAEDYLRRLRQKGLRNHIRALAGVGFDYDDNRNAAPSSGQRLFLDAPLTLTPSSTKKGDVAALSLAELEAWRDVGAQARHKIFGMFSYYRSDQDDLSRLSLQNYSLRTGGVYRGSWAEVSPSFEFNHLLLAQETYLRSRSARLRFDRKLGARFNAFGEAAHTDLRYNRTQVAPTGDERTGDRIEGGAGLGAALSRNMRLTLAYTHANVGAARKFHAYARDSGALRHSWLLPHGQFLLSSLTLNWDRYEIPDPAVSVGTRRDEIRRARLTYGLPLSLLAKPLGGLVWTATYEYYNAGSNITNYEFTSHGFSSMVTYRWDYGF